MTKAHKAYFIFLLLWILLVSIGSLVGFSLSSFLIKNFSDRDLGLGVFLLLISVGLFIGLGQWIAINSRLKKVWYWIPATTIGFSFGSFIAYFIIDFIGAGLLHLDTHYFSAYQLSQVIATMMAAGMFTGALQWLALKRKLKTSLIWSLTSGLSLVFGGVVMIFTINARLINYLDSSIFGLAFGLFTGLFAEPLLLRPESKNN
jgi:hypothetical protein